MEVLFQFWKDRCLIKLVKMEFLTFLVVFIIVVIGWYYKKYHERYAMASKLPGPPMLPIVGNALMFLGKSPSEVLNILVKLSKKHGRTLRVMVGTQIQVLINDPKQVEMVLGSQKLIDKSDEYDFIEKWLGTGLLVSTGQKWFTRRKIITPTFHFKILEQFVEVFDKHSEIFVQNLSKLKGQRCDVFPKITLCALDVICGEIIFSCLSKAWFKRKLIRLIQFLSSRDGDGRRSQRTT